jgi:hypothetical protein
LLKQPIALPDEISHTLLHSLPGISVALARRSEAVGEAELRQRHGCVGAPLSAFTLSGGGALPGV